MEVDEIITQLIEWGHSPLLKIVNEHRVITIGVKHIRGRTFYDAAHEAYKIFRPRFEYYEIYPADTDYCQRGWSCIVPSGLGFVTLRRTERQNDVVVYRDATGKVLV